MHSRIGSRKTEVAVINTETGCQSHWMLPATARYESSEKVTDMSSSSDSIPLAKVQHTDREESSRSGAFSTPPVKGELGDWEAWDMSCSSDTLSSTAVVKASSAVIVRSKSSSVVVPPPPLEFNLFATSTTLLVVF